MKFERLFKTIQIITFKLYLNFKLSFLKCIGEKKKESLV